MRTTAVTSYASCQAAAALAAHGAKTSAETLVNFFAVERGVRVTVESDSSRPEIAGIERGVRSIPFYKAIGPLHLPPFCNYVIGSYDSHVSGCGQNETMTIYLLHPELMDTFVFDFTLLPDTSGFSPLRTFKLFQSSAGG